MGSPLNESRFYSKSTGNLRQIERRNDYLTEYPNTTRTYVWPTAVSRRVSQADCPWPMSPMPGSASRTSSTSSRPPSIRSRASSAASSGLDSSQVHVLLNKRDSRSSIFTTTSNGDPQSPTSILSNPSREDVEMDFAHRKTSISEMRRYSDVRRFEDKPPPPRKSSNIITVKPRSEKSSLNTDRSADAVLVHGNDRSLHNSNEDDEYNRRVLERNLTEPSLTMATTMYLNEIVWQIDELVYVGGIEASCNMNLLCRLNVAFFMDLTDDPERKDNKTPCLCSKPSRHSRYMIDIKLPEPLHLATWDDVNGEKVSMTDLFEKFISLTEKATKAGRKVLVFSNKGRNKAPAFAAAYLMNRHRLSRAVAVNRVLMAMDSMRPAVNICDYLQRSLMRYQAYKGIQVDTAHDYTHSLPLFRVPRTAWI